MNNRGRQVSFQTFKKSVHTGKQQKTIRAYKIQTDLYKILKESVITPGLLAKEAS